ncbi:MAG: polysaccharide deacetylase family protein [Aeromicrobium sp.]|nr:polysaccharide deacetylase family protein [Aeromicrobium sp.]
MVLGATMAAAASGYWTTMSPHSQRLGQFPYRATTDIPGPEKTVALTFDDGPNEPYTSQIADYLNERAIKATFFQVGHCVRRHPDTSRSLLAAGHLIGNHSNYHRFSRCWTRRNIAAEIRSSQRTFRDILGCEPALYRPPWLARTPATFSVLEDSGLRPVSGDFCHALEPLQPSPQRIAQRALAKVQPGSIIIFHDGYDAKGGVRTNTVAAVKIVVETLTHQGYTFSTVDRLLGAPAYLT